jgi:hypothetical protein
MQELIFGVIFGMGFMGVMWMTFSENKKRGKEDSKKVIVRYKDKTSEIFNCTDWQTYNNLIQIEDSNTDEFIIKEINLKEVKSIGFALNKNHGEKKDE